MSIIMFSLYWIMTSVMEYVYIIHILTGLATKSGNTLTEIAVKEGKLDVIKYLAAEQGVTINGEL